jgi:hypothetical protein
VSDALALELVVVVSVPARHLAHLHRRRGFDVGDPILASNLTRRVDFASFMVEALENDELIHEAPAIVDRQTTSALAHAASE